MLRIVMACLAFVFIVGSAEGAYDCGRYQARLAGKPVKYHGCNLALAREWARCMPHTSLHAGAVVVSWRKGRASGGGPGGHVARVERVIDSCHAIVRDNRGVYRRNICHRRLAVVDPNGNQIQPKHKKDFSAL